MSAIPGKLLPIVRRATPLYSKVVAAQRAQVIQRQLSAVSDLVKVTDFPVHLVAANQVLLRFGEVLLQLLGPPGRLDRCRVGF